MRLLFEMDRHDHAQCTRSFVRDSARSIIIRNGRVAMVHSLKYDYYKFPGGGIEKGEDPAEDAPVPQDLDEYEAGEIYVPEFVDPHTAIRKNRSVRKTPITA